MKNDEELARNKQAEVDVWMGQVAMKVRQYVAQGLSHEAAEERAIDDVRREIRSQP